MCLLFNNRHILHCCFEAVIRQFFLPILARSGTFNVLPHQKNKKKTKAIQYRKTFQFFFNISEFCVLVSNFMLNCNRTVICEFWPDLWLSGPVYIAIFLSNLENWFQKFQEFQFQCSEYLFSLLLIFIKLTLKLKGQKELDGASGSDPSAAPGEGKSNAQKFNKGIFFRLGCFFKVLFWFSDPLFPNKEINK